MMGEVAEDLNRYTYISGLAITIKVRGRTRRYAEHDGDDRRLVAAAVSPSKSP